MKKILVVEDNKTNQRLTSSLLKKKGWEVKIAANGKEAVQTLKVEAFDLVLMDIQMPEMDGFQAVGEIRKCKETASLPIIAFTSDVVEGVDKETYLKAGMDDYLEKPVDKKIFYSTIEKYIN
jgi:CheY-like chemotaxis protein